MKNSATLPDVLVSLLFVLLLTACSGQQPKGKSSNKIDTDNTFFIPKSLPGLPISEYVRNVFEDKNGGLWFGTNGYGVAHYDEMGLCYFSIDEGFGGRQITGITEDLDGNIWFATDHGIVMYSMFTSNHPELEFVNYPKKEFFKGKGFWSILADSHGIIWAGSSAGVYRFIDSKWKFFELAHFIANRTSGILSDKTIWDISEDSKGNIWFATSGNGAIRYNGSTYTQFTKKDGLTDDNVDNVLEDREGNMWFGTRYGGLSRYDGSMFIHYTDQDSIRNNEVCVVYEDREGHIWFSSEGHGVYRFDGYSFTNYAEDQGLGVRAVQTIYEDREGRLWVGGGGGLYRFDGKVFYNVTQKGPWR